MSRRDLLFHNPGLKLASIGLAALLWYAVHGRRDYTNPGGGATPGETVVQDYVRLPITVLQNPGETHLYHVQPGEVSIRVAGRRSVLQELRGSDLEVFVNAADTGDRRLLVRQVKVLLPSGVALRRIEPNTVQLERLDPEAPSSTESPPSP